MSLELAAHLKRGRYDTVWMQWASDAYTAPFYAWCHRFGLPVVHTIHNVVPHESRPGDAARCGDLYHNADALIVHSMAAQSELRAMFPEVAAKALVSRIGLYTMYPQDRSVRERMRQSLNVREDQPLLLFFGGVRPYKNIDAVLEAFRAPALRSSVLVVTGREGGYQHFTPSDPFARTRARTRELDVADRVRLLPGRLDLCETAELFEASDILVLPYISGSGSASLLLGMTFGKHIIATRTGGMDEYLAHYENRTLLDGPDAASVTTGLICAIQRLRQPTTDRPTSLDHLTWPHIASRLIDALRDLQVTCPSVRPQRVIQT